MSAKLSQNRPYISTDADTDTNTDILARIVARMSACRSACHRNNFRKSRVGRVGEDPRKDVGVGVSVGIVEIPLIRFVRNSCRIFHSSIL